MTDEEPGPSDPDEEDQRHSLPQVLTGPSAGLQGLMEQAASGQFSQSNEAVAQLLSITSTAMSAYLGPVPPPEVAKAWNDLVPGSADRMLVMAEKQAAHRQELEKVAVEGGARRAWSGLWLGFIIGMFFLAISALLVLARHGVEGTILGTVDIGGLVGSFVLGRQDQRREREQKTKASQLPEPPTDQTGEPRPG